MIGHLFILRSVSDQQLFSTLLYRTNINEMNIFDKDVNNVISISYALKNKKKLL